MGRICGFLYLTVFLAAVYSVIPDLFLHRLGIGSWKRQYDVRKYLDGLVMKKDKTGRLSAAK